MERNVGLLALLTIATAAAFVAPPVEVKGFNLLHLTLLVFAGVRRGEHRAGRTGPRTSSWTTSWR